MKYVKQYNLDEEEMNSWGKAGWTLKFCFMEGPHIVYIFEQKS